MTLLLSDPSDLRDHRSLDPRIAKVMVTAVADRAQLPRGLIHLLLIGLVGWISAAAARDEGRSLESVAEGTELGWTQEETTDTGRS